MKALLVIVGFLVAIGYAILWSIVILPYPDFWFGTTFGIMQILVMKPLVGMICWTYYLAVATAPGGPPMNYVPPGATEEELEAERNTARANKYKQKSRQLGRKIRFCYKCNNFKPPRTHHCSEIEKCVLRMDHYCPWVSNTIGFNNHKYFVLFLIYGFIGCLYLCLLYLSTVISIVMRAKRGEELEHMLTPFSGVAIALNLCIFIPITLGIGSLLTWQVLLARGNLTTVEVYEKKALKREAKSQGKRYKWLYDLGVARNVRQFFGPTRLEWLTPSLPRVGDGLSFPTRNADVGQVV